MTEGKTDLLSRIQLQRDIFEYNRKQHFEGLCNIFGVNLNYIDSLSDMFSEGIKDGSVTFLPNKDGTGVLNVNMTIDEKKISGEFQVPDKTEAAFFMGMQVSLRPPEVK